MIAQVDNKFYRLSIKKTYTRLLSYALYEGRPLTTKGRWINPIVFFLYRIQSLLPTGKKITKPIFILGTGRSGTTILGVTLGMHNDVGFLNEPKALWSYLHKTEDLIGNYNQELASYRLSENDVNEQIIKKAHRIFGNYLRFGCSSRVVDKYPELVFRTEFITAIFPDACFLFLYRNGYDTCHSIKHWSERLGTVDKGEKHNWWGKDDRKWELLCDQVVSADDVLGAFVGEISRYTDHKYRAAVEWIVTMKEGLALMARNPQNVMGVKYEDYVSCPELRYQLLKFCNLSPDEKYNKYCEVVLKAPKPKPRIDFPTVIRDEFIRVSKQLGYE